MFFHLIFAKENLKLHGMDVKIAFLNRHFSEEIFVDQPGGVVNYDFPAHLVKLLKALYKLKQAPGQWFVKIHAILWRFALKAIRMIHWLTVIVQKLR